MADPDPDRLRDEIANGDRPPPPGWPGRVGTATDLPPVDEPRVDMSGSDFGIMHEVADCLRQYRRDMQWPTLDEGQRQRRIEWIDRVLAGIGA